MKLTIDIFGWIGMVLILISFYLVSNGKVDAQTNTFQIINLVGALFIGVNAYYYGALPSVGLNIIWLLIAVFTMLRINRKKF